MFGNDKNKTYWRRESIDTVFYTKSKKKKKREIDSRLKNQDR
jgi:hypothetical protein